MTISTDEQSQTTNQTSIPPQFEFVGTHRALTADDYWIDLDEYRRGSETTLLAHVRFDHFSPVILDELPEVWARFCTCMGIFYGLGFQPPLVFAFGEADGRDWTPILTQLGFKFSQQVNCLDGASRPLYVNTVYGNAQLNNQ